LDEGEGGTAAEEERARTARAAGGTEVKEGGARKEEGGRRIWKKGIKRM
jgi:hypothetical protein